MPIARPLSVRALQRPSPAIHPVWLRITHWLNALAVVILVCSGWRIYNASPLFPFRFPDALTLGGWLGGALQWHFAAMWLLVANGCLYLGLNIVSGRLGRRFFPIRPRQVLQDSLAALKGQLSHQDLAQYNSVQRLVYLVLVLGLVLSTVSGLVVWKSVQFPLLNLLLGGYDMARLVHFLAMSLVVALVALHVLMVVLVPRTLLTMVRGH